MKNQDAEERPLPFQNDEIQRLAQNSFGVSYLFPWQRLVIANILDAEDSPEKCGQIVLLPTGAGKSLCFLVPALILEGATLVIYPLLALMSDQKRRMDECGIESVTFKGGMTSEEREENFLRIKNGVKVIIANPEILQTEPLVTRLSQCGISHIAIDEAHCVSEWGDSFRPAYLTLGNVIKKLGVKLVTAFTATASPHVLSRISEVLFEGEAHVVRSESDRKNIHYHVIKTNAKTQEALLLSKTEKLPAIFFCGTRAKTESLARELNFYFNEDVARFYHAGLTRSEKKEIESWFFEKQNAILCATCAYGMGVDKKNIRTVIHIDSPRTAEQYIQEAGRGGRDGEISKAILLWSKEDSIEFQKYSEEDREYSMKLFAESETCRRQVLLDALGAEKAFCSGCDICNEKLKVNERKRKSVSLENHIDDEKIILNFIKKNQKVFTKKQLIDELIQKLNSESRRKGMLNVWEHTAVEDVLDCLEKSGAIYTCKKIWKGRITIGKH